MLTDRSACGVSAFVSVALLLTGTGSATPPPGVAVAVLLRVPVADDKIAQVATYVADPPGGRTAGSLMLPEPLAVHAPPLALAQVQVAPVQTAGNASATVTTGALDGPVFAATIV